MPSSSALLCLVCGFERGGTTALSEVLRQAPGIEAGFEGGFLFARDPAAFPSVDPYYGMALRGWGLALEDMEYVCSAPGWEEMYRRLAERFRPGERVRVFDKTPRYMERLSEVMAKVPGAPVVVVVRDPRALFWSWLKRAGERPIDWLEAYPVRYRSYAAGYQAALQAGLGDRLLLVRHEDLSLHPQEELQRVFSFLDLDFEPGYLSFSPRFRNVRGQGMTSAFVLEYRDHLTSEECRQILAATAGCADWWWEPPEGFTPEAPPAEAAAGGPAAPRSPEERRRRRRVAAVELGGPGRLAARVVGRVPPQAAILDLSAPFVAPAEDLAGTVEQGRYRRLDWEARLRANGPGRPLADTAGRFDLVVAHSLLPFLSAGEVSLLFEDVASVLAPSGRLLATLYVDEAGEYARRAMPQLRGRSFPHRAPYHLSGEALRTRAAAAGLTVIGVEDIGHPSGQRMAVLGRLSEAE